MPQIGWGLLDFWTVARNIDVTDFVCYLPFVTEEKDGVFSTQKRSRAKYSHKTTEGSDSWKDHFCTAPRAAV